MEHEHFLNALFTAIDSKDTDKFTSFLSDDCTFQFGNVPTVTGKQHIAPFVSAFFNSIEALSHSITDAWALPDRLICHGSVSYTRRDRSVLTVPFCNIFKLQGELISEYLVFADTSAL